MTPDYKRISVHVRSVYLTGELRGLEKALQVVNRRDVDPATVKWLVKLIEEVKEKMEEE